MAKLDFNLHPSAFRVVGPQHPGRDQHISLDDRHQPGVIHILFGLLTALVMTVCRDELVVLLQQTMTKKFEFVLFSKSP